ncbi:signal peptide peptidase SppA [Candidatus Sumerlaeota bacterium]|nr:signal peptide peptidase SppA [Candidatus Sumerlaeota bacterium]
MMIHRLAILTAIAAIGSGCAIVTIPALFPREVEMREFTVQPAQSYLTRNKILMLDVSGMITDERYSGLFSEWPSTLADVRDALDKAQKDNHIKAVILRINSPGGTVTASDSIYNQIRLFKERRAKKGQSVVVVASLQSTGASGGYYVALACDEIYAHPTAITGAIGVIGIFPKLADLTRKIGVDVRVIKSADKKDMGSMWRDFTPDEQAILQRMIDEMFERFAQIVAEKRSLTPETVRRLADGRIYTAKQALENRLIDGISYLDDVIERTKQLAHLADARVITYRRVSEFSGGIYSRSSVNEPLGRARGELQAAPQVNLLQINADGLPGPSRLPGFYYLWMP